MTYTRTHPPTQLARGEQIGWTKSYADYPATLYTLDYRFRGQTVGIDVTATADGDQFNTLITPTLSGKFGAAGIFKWQAWLTEIANPTNTFVIEEGRSKVTAGYAVGSTAAVDERSIAKITLDALDAAIQGRASSVQLEYEISTPAGSRRVKHLAMSDLTAMRSYYARLVAAELAAERAREGKGFGMPVKVRFRSQ